MNRRKSLKILGGAGVLGAFAGSHYWLTKPRNHPHLTIDGTIAHLTDLPLDSLESSGQWQVVRTFHHLAQSIEFSIDGYPELKPVWFRETIGPLAFSVFNARGEMTHALDEVIPGETVIDTAGELSGARDRLVSALEIFDNHTAQLQPHFAYGVLSKEQYAVAHVMHINNHFEEISTTST